LVEIVDGYREACTNQAAGEVPAQVAEADEGVAHEGVSRRRWRRCWRYGRSSRPPGYRCLVHLQVQRLALVGMGGGDRLVELDPEAGRVGHQHVAFLPADRRLQDLGVEAAPGADRFEDQEVRA